MHRHRVVPRRLRGFTIAEVLLATTLGALLITATASATGSFGQAVAQLRSDVVDDYEAVTARIARDVRYAWWVEVPARDRLRIADSSNQVTEYFRVGNSLLVRHPSGDAGSIITGLDNVLFEQTTSRRLRDGGQTPVIGRISNVPAPAAATAALKLDSSNSVALAFTVPSSAGAMSVAGVGERFLSRTPNVINLPIAQTLPGGSLHGDIFAARAPGDARPRPAAGVLASFDTLLGLLPPAVVLVPQRGAVPAVYAAPLVTVPFNLTGAQALVPGVAYTAVVTIRGPVAGAVLGSYVSAAGSNPGVAFRAAAGDPWASLSSVVAFSLSGNSAATSTQAADVGSQVRITLTPSGEAAHIASAAVFSQVLAEDPWLGVIPGESPAGP